MTNNGNVEKSRSHGLIYLTLPFLDQYITAELNQFIQSIISKYESLIVGLIEGLFVDIFLFLCLYVFIQFKRRISRWSDSVIRDVFTYFSNSIFMRNVGCIRFEHRLLFLPHQVSIATISRIWTNFRVLEAHSLMNLFFLFVHSDL